MLRFIATWWTGLPAELLTLLLLGSMRMLSWFSSTLVASISHILSVFKISRSICDIIDQLCLRFWWRSSTSSSGMAFQKEWVALELGKPIVLIRRFQPGKLGGLFIIRSLFCLAFTRPNNLRCCPSGLVLVLLFFRLGGCRGIMYGVQVLYQGLAWNVSSRSQVRIAHDSWVLDVSVSFKDYVLGSAVPTHVSSLINLRSYVWDITIILQLFDCYSQFYFGYGKTFCSYG